MRGKRGIVAKGRERRCRREGNLPRKGGKGAFRGRERDVSGKGKGRFGEEKRGGNWDRERDKLKSRRRIEGRWTGIERKLSRDQTGIKRKSNRNQTRMERNPALTLSMRLERPLFQRWKGQSFCF